MLVKQNLQYLNENQFASNIINIFIEFEGEEKFLCLEIIQIISKDLNLRNFQTGL